jgi:hypothetical protein
MQAVELAKKTQPDIVPLIWLCEMDGLQATPKSSKQSTLARSF